MSESTDPREPVFGHQADELRDKLLNKLYTAAAVTLLEDIRALDIGDDRATCRIIGRTEAVLDGLLQSLGPQV